MLVGIVAAEGVTPQVRHLVTRHGTALCGAGPLRVVGEFGDSTGDAICRRCATLALRGRVGAR